MHSCTFYLKNWASWMFSSKTTTLWSVNSSCKGKIHLINRHVSHLKMDHRLCKIVTKKRFFFIPHWTFMHTAVPFPLTQHSPIQHCLWPSLLSRSLRKHFLDSSSLAPWRWISMASTLKPGVQLAVPLSVSDLNWNLWGSFSICYSVLFLP